MKNLLTMIGAAMLGGVLSIGIWKAVGEESTVTHEYIPASKAIQANYVGSSAADKIDFDFTAAAEIATPGVVHITSTIKEPSFAQRDEMDPFQGFFGDEFFGKNNRRPEPQPSVGSGSGVIIRPDGYIVTNNHVVAGASEIRVTLNDNRSFDAEVVGTDPNTDLALIKIRADKLPALTIANADHVKVGEWVLAIGNPFNLESTVTAGIVSAKGRNINILTDRAAIESFIQTDAAINPGNSGGALVNLEGELVGINTAIATPTGVYAGYGFAVPSTIMKKVVEDLIAYGKVQRAYLGVVIRNLDSKLVQDKHLSVNEGIYIDSVMESGAAKEAGIKEGDVIVNMDGQQMKSSAQLQENLAGHKPGDEVSITLLHQGKEKTVNVNLKNVSGEIGLVKAYKDDILKGLGAEFTNISKREGERLGISGGIQVTHLYPGRLTEQTEIQEGFIITSLNNKKVDSVDTLISELKKSSNGVLMEGIYPQNPQTKIYYGFALIQ